VPSLLTLVDPPAPKHPLGFSVRASGGTCATCAWRFSGGRGRAVDRCRQAEGARVDPAWPACDHYEDDAEVECTRCGACCREAYGAVIVSSRDPVATRHPDLLHRDGRTLLVRRDGDRCAALTGGAGPDDGYLCRIYAERPRTCRDFTRLGEHCLTARRRVGLS
jgi:hypothetical protein